MPPTDRRPDETPDAELDEDFEQSQREKPQAGGLTPTREQARTPAPTVLGWMVRTSAMPTTRSPTACPHATPATGEEEPVAERQAEPIRPFQGIGQLPDDVVEAFESFKLAILRHKRENWQEISCPEMVADARHCAVTELALAPISEPAPF